MSVITVDGRKDKYSSLDFTRVRKLRELQQVLAYPSDNDLANAIENNNVVQHNSLTQKDIKIAENIFGPSVPRVKGKTVRRKNKLQQEDEFISILSTIVERFKENITYWLT